MIIQFHINEIEGKMVVEGLYDKNQESSPMERVWAEAVSVAVIDFLKNNIKPSKLHVAIHYPITPPEDRN